MGLANVGPPFLERGERDEEEYSVVEGLSQAVEALCQPSPLQESYMSSPSQQHTPLVNNGRIICFTHMKRSARPVGVGIVKLIQAEFSCKACLAQLFKKKKKKKKKLL